jgi:hypothetical protein
MSGRKAWLVVAVAFILGAGVVLAATKLLPGAPPTSVDPIRLQAPADGSEDGKKDVKKDGREKDKREKGAGEPSGTKEQPSPGGAPPAPPAPPVPAGDDDDDDDDDDSGDDDDDD